MTRSMTVEKAVERYLKERRPEVAESTYRNHKYALKRFVEWSDKADLEDISNLDGFHIHDFKIYRRDNGGINEVTLYNNLCTVRVFIQWLESMQVVESGIAEDMILPDPDDDKRDDKIDPETADAILKYLEKFEYATRDHTVLLVLWKTGMRTGSLRSLDLRDYDSREPAISINHRPKTDTPLKNKSSGERMVALDDETADVLDDYIKHKRKGVTDENGREPLFTTAKGRIGKVRVDNSYRVMRIDSRDKPVPRITNCFQMPGGNVSCKPRQGEVFHGSLL